MSERIAIGVGCRRDCPASLIEGLIRDALQRVPAAERLGLFTICDKRGETGLIEVAGRFGLRLVFLRRETLRAQAPFIRTVSNRTDTLFGVPSVAEAAALAGAGPGAALIVTRIANPGATCAVAACRARPA